MHIVPPVPSRLSYLFSLVYPGSKPYGGWGGTRRDSPPSATKERGLASTCGEREGEEEGRGKTQRETRPQGVMPEHLMMLLNKGVLHLCPLNEAN